MNSKVFAVIFGFCGLAFCLGLTGIMWVAVFSEPMPILVTIFVCGVTIGLTAGMLLVCAWIIHQVRIDLNDGKPFGGKQFWD